MTDASLNLPSDFDYSILLSDNLPPDHSEIPPGEEPPSRVLPSESFSDDLDAIDRVVEERREYLTKKGVVIQHRVRDNRPVFHSSSLPPDSPTPRRDLTVPRPGFFQDTFQPSSPTRKTSQDLWNPFRSSPPLPETEEMTGTEGPLAREDVENLSTRDPDVELNAKMSAGSPRRSFVPNFTLPLTGGGLFSKKLGAPKEVAHAKTITTGDVEMECTPPRRALTSTSNSVSASIRPATSFETPLARGRTKFHSATTSLKEVTVVTSAGETIRVRRTERTLSTSNRLYSEAELPSGGPKTYFGVDIHSLLDMCDDGKTSKRGESAVQIPEEKTNSMRGKKQLLWTEKYRAKKFTDLVGDERTHRHTLRWLKRWDPIVFPSQSKTVQKGKLEMEEEPEHQKILLLHGPPGLGKTTLAHVAARQAGYEPLEINASDDRSSSVVKGQIKDMLTIEGVKSCGVKSGKKQTNAGKPVCLVIDEIDGVTGGAGGGGSGGGSDAGFIKALIDLILEDQRTSQGSKSGAVTGRKGKRKENFRLLRPIFAICNDLYAPSLKPLRPYAEVVQMRLPPQALMVDRLEWIFGREGYATEDGAVRRIVELSLSGGSSARKGDMRGALVNCEWIAARMKLGCKEKNHKGRNMLTRKAVEEELTGSRIGDSDGKGGNGGRVGLREVVESVFHIKKEPQARRGAPKATKQSHGAKLLEVVEGLGEFDKITMDCFATYPTRSFNDDSILSKPNIAYEWLCFSDLLSSRVYNDQAYELSSYLSYPIHAFHQLFASSTPASSDPDSQDAVETAFTGISAEWEVREATNENTSVLSSIHSALTSIRLAQTFKSPASLATELAPLVNCILSPQVNPVLVGGSGYAVASVRRDTEKRLVARAVSAMEATGVRFQKVRVEASPGASGGSGWAFRMDPPLDAVCLFCTSAKPRAEPVRYAVRQVLDQECRKATALREKQAREARMGALSASAAAAAAAIVTMEDSTKLVDIRPTRKVKRDFFGRLVIEKDNARTGEEGDAGSLKKKRKLGEEERGRRDVWVSYNEGFSNAVRKGIRLDELMDGLI